MFSMKKSKRVALGAEVKWGLRTLIWNDDFYVSILAE